MTNYRTPGNVPSQFRRRTVMGLMITAALAILSPSLFGADAASILADADRIFELDGVYSRSTLSITRNGREQAPQVMDGYESEAADGTPRSLSIFREPARVNGTAYLMIDDDLWVRFASTGRIRKLSSSAKKNSAAGSDFSYADMGEGSSSFTDQYRPVDDGRDSVNGEDCHRFILTPNPGERDAYEKLVVWVSTDGHRYQRIQYWDKGAPVKEMDLQDYRPVAGVDYPFRITMRSLARDSVSVITTEMMEPDSPKVEERMFSTAYLETIR